TVQDMITMLWTT
nr:immunoglobulin heavy chain junction region [Mus musculus]